MANEVSVKTNRENVKIRPYEHRTKYYEAGPQGVIHHSYYMNWLENARMDLMTQLGLGNKQMEVMEIMSPELSVSIDFRSAVHFDETVMIETKLLDYDGHEMEIAYRIYDKANGEDRAVARSKHCFVNNSGVPISLKRVYPELDTKFFEFN